MEEYIILDSKWWSTRDDAIGIVAVQDKVTGRWKAYIGVTSPYSTDQKHDEQHIAAWGAGLLPAEAQAFFRRLDIALYEEGQS